MFDQTIWISPAKLRTFRSFLLGLVLTPMLALAEDTDVYSPPIDPDFRPSLMFMIDSSNSMRFTGSAFKPWRFDRLKEPLINFMRTTSDLNVGLSSFNGQDRGGAIISPVANLDTDLCPDASCDEITLRSQIQRDSDGGYEWADTGQVTLHSAGMTYGEWTNVYGSVGWYLENPGETVVETTGQNMVEAEVLPLFVTNEGDKTIVGLHWPNISVGANYSVYNTFMDFAWAGDEFLDLSIGEGLDDIKATISLDSRPFSPPFADAAGQRVSDRPYLSDTLPWTIARSPDWDREIDATTMVRSPDFHTLFNQVIQPGYQGPMTVKLELEPGVLANKFNAINLLGVHNRGGQLPRPRFVYRYERLDLVPRPRLAVHRFDRLNIPRGAKINSAHMESETWQNANEVDPANFTIRAEDAGDSAPLEERNSNLSARAPTGATVNWNPPSFHGDLTRKRTPDITALVQEVINRDDWCAGNALALLIDGTGTRYGWNHEAGKLLAASLHVSYDPKSVDVNNNCRTSVGNEAIFMSADDSITEDTDGTLHENQAVFETGNSLKWLGLQFDKTRLSSGDKIAEAILSLTSLDQSTARVTFDTYVAVSSFDEGFDIDGVRAKLSSAPKFRWRSSPLNEGDRVESPDIAPLIQAAIDSPDWTRDSTLWIGINRVAGVDGKFVTAHGANGEGPSLSILKKVTGTAAANIPLRTVRDEIIEQIEILPATGNTPLVDAFLETAAYMSGGDVLHGNRRGEQASYNTEHRISAANSYTGGSIYRPIGCTEDKLDDPACIGEAINGLAKYTKPESSECRANQIILVTDGDPTTSTAKAETSARIKSMAGISECDASPDSQECATDLARYLSSTDAGHHPINISTIGFEFQSEFLSAVAEAGQGRFHSVASSGQMSAALRAIGNDVEHDVATAVAPVAAISQFNRATHRDDLYFAMFKPAYKDSLWTGNVKRYELGILPDTDRIGVVDANGKAVLDKEIGSINPTARSFWSEIIDGSDVTKGGAAKQLISDRNILTLPTASLNDDQGPRNLVPFNTENTDIEANDLNVPAAERNNAINWMRGVDVLDENKNGDVIEARQSMGAAMHTTPVLLNYGKTGAPGASIVFAGTHEGYLHAVDSASGKELFAFIPHELYSNVGKFYTQANDRMQHGIDGPITVWGDDKNQDGMIDKDSGEKAWATFGMRRGGNHYFTLDITDPSNPTLAWSIDKTKTGFEDLHQTWSKAVHARIKRDGASPGQQRDVLIFGNGYNPTNDAIDRNPNIGNSDSGAVFIVDAKTGELIHRIDSSDHAEMIWSVPSDIAVIDFDFDGTTDLLMFGDLGGNVWRADIRSTVDNTGMVSNARPLLTLSATLADRLSGLSSDPADRAIGDRRFFNTPDIAYMASPSGQTYLGAAIGSGRRDHPLGKATENRMHFLHLDPYTPEASPITEDHLIDATNVAAAADATKRGWFIDLKHDGEKMLSSPVILDGRVLATTYVPESASTHACEPRLGTGRLYVVDAFTGEGLLDDSEIQQELDYENRSRELKSGGIPPPISLLVSEQDVNTPVALVGLESVEGVKMSRQRKNTYWAEY